MALEKRSGEAKYWNGLTADEMVERVLVITESERRAILTNGFMNDGGDVTEIVTGKLIPALHDNGLKVFYIDWADAETYSRRESEGRLSWDDGKKIFEMQRSVVPTLINISRVEMMGGLADSGVIIIDNAQKCLRGGRESASLEQAIAGAVKGGKTLLLIFDKYDSKVDNEAATSRLMRDWRVENVQVLRLFRGR